MGNGLWTPPGARAPRVTTFPVGDVRLSDGRRLVRQAGRQWQLPADVLDAAAWEGPKRLCVLASLDDTPHGRLLHVSMSYPSKHPDWETIRAVRDAFYPDNIDVMMVLPRAEDYVNLHRHTFHLWQTPTTWGMR